MLFFVFVFGHIFANYNAVRAIVMKTVNRNRFHILARHYFESNEALDARKVNKLEPVLRPCSGKFNIQLGCSIKQLKALFPHCKDLGSLADKFNCQKFMLMFDVASEKAFVLLHHSSNDETLMRALFQVEFVQYKWREGLNLEQALHQADSMFDEFIRKALDKDWSFAYTQLSPNVYRYSLDEQKPKKN